MDPFSQSSVLKDVIFNKVSIRVLAADFASHADSAEGSLSQD